ncbi:hypothetical protein ACP4OV_015968 [Aristida adscensionis]
MTIDGSENFMKDNMTSGDQGSLHQDVKSYVKQHFHPSTSTDLPYPKQDHESYGSRIDSPPPDFRSFRRSLPMLGSRAADRY